MKCNLLFTRVLFLIQISTYHQVKHRDVCFIFYHWCHKCSIGHWTDIYHNQCKRNRLVSWFRLKKKWIIKKTIDVAFTLQLPRMFTCPSLVFRRPLFSISAQRFGLWYGQYRTVIIWIKVEGTYRNYNRIRLSSKISVYCYYSCGVIDFKWFLRVTGCNMKQWNSKICLSIKDLFS